jgi:hypothetical protein
LTCHAFLTFVYRPLKATKAIESFFINATPNTQRLPRDVVELLQAPPSDDAVAGTLSLHEELLKLQQTAKDHNVSTALFLQCLTHLAPRLNNVNHLEQWFKAYVNPAINSAGHKNEDVEASQEFFLSVLTNGVLVKLAADEIDNENSSNGRRIADTDDIENPSQLYFYWIFDLYQGFLSKHFEFMRTESGLALAERKRFIIQNAKDLLIKYGHLHPLEFFKYLAKKAVKPENRLKVLMLASQLVSSTDSRNGSDKSSVVGDVLEMYPNLSVITKTEFPEILFNCLRYDESSTTIQICINTLSMFLPYMYKVEDFELDIPRLLVLLGRAACSPHSTVSAVETALEDKDTSQNQQESHNAETSWSTLNQVFGLPELRRPDISPLFCVLYGLFPFNVLEFSNNPRGYLTAAKYAEPLPENWDSFQIKRVLKAIFPSYALNPFMAEYNKEQEASEIRRSRLDSVDDIIVHCLSLRVRDDIFPLNAGLNDVENFENGNILNNMSARALYERQRKEETPMSPLNTTDGTDLVLGPFRGSGNQQAISSPLLKSVDALLEEHFALNNRHQSGDDYDTPLRKRSSTISPSLAKPSLDYSRILTASPLIVPQVEPSSSISPINVNSPSANNTARSDTEPEPLALSPTQETTEKSQERTIKERIQNQQLIGSNDPSILFYQRELLLIKNELDFIRFLERYSQYQYLKLHKQRTKDSLYNDSIGDLILLNQQLRKKVQFLEKSSSQAQKQLKTKQSDRQSYESSLLQKNRDMRTSQQELSRKHAKLELDVENLRKERDELFQSVIDKETRITNLEFHVTELTSKSALVDELKQTLARKEEEIKSLELPLENFRTEHDDQVTNVMAKIKELTQARESAVYNRREVEVKLRRHINNLQAAIRDYQEKPKTPSNKLLADYNSYKLKDETRYKELSASFKDLSEKYNALNETFTKYVVDNERRNEASGSNYHSPTPTTPQPQLQKTFLGFDAEVTSGTNPSSSASRSMHSISTGSTTAAGATSQLPPGSALPQIPMQKKGTALLTATGGQVNTNIAGANSLHEQQQHSQRPRFRGRGGVQGSMRKKETPTSSAQGPRTFKFM